MTLHPLFDSPTPGDGCPSNPHDDTAMFARLSGGAISAQGFPKPTNRPSPSAPVVAQPPTQKPDGQKSVFH